MGLETHIDWPAVSGEYKVAQFYVDGLPYMRFGKLGEDFVSSIVARFAQEISTEVKINDKKVPVFVDERSNKVAGAGRCDLKLDEKLAEFYGVSAGYEIGINQKHLEALRQFVPDMALRYVKKKRAA